MMRALVLFAHPVADSFSAALRRVAVERLEARGWDVDDCDLYAEKFAPALSSEERLNYHDPEVNRASVASYVERLNRADALVLVFPVWNFGYPAILKGFFDRVFLPGVSFRLVDGKVLPNLKNIRRLAAVTTYGGSRIRAIWAGDPPRKIVTRSLRATCQAEKTRYIALYDMNRADKPRRAAFIARVEGEMDRF
ncbi:MAG: NAD(P)H-dependent oxidoreductase [Albidovulum sp.]|nr:NAD(P)H-dependent oxidoreductase [Albidovulum sp.]